MASTRASLSETNLSMLFIVLPPTELLNSYQKLAHSIRSAILKNNDQNSSLKSTREGILPMLMNGQASVLD